MYIVYTYKHASTLFQRGGDILTIQVGKGGGGGGGGSRATARDVCLRRLLL